MAKRTKQSAKEADKRKEEYQVKLTVKNAEMISDSIKIAVSLNRIAGIGPEGILTSMVFVVGDFIDAMATTLEVPREQIMKDLLDSIRDYVNDDSNPSEELANWL